MTTSISVIPYFVLNTPSLLKLMFSEKITTFQKNLPFFLMTAKQSLLTISELFFKFCGSLRKHHFYVQSKSNSSKYSTGEQTQTQHHGPKIRRYKFVKTMSVPNCCTKVVFCHHHCENDQSKKGKQ